MRGRARFWMLLWLPLASACDRDGNADANANPTEATSASPLPTVSEPVLADPVPESPQLQPTATVTRDASRSPYLEDVLSNDRNKLKAAKNALKAKQARGEATQQDEALLRGLCRQLGDMSCAH